MNPSPASPDFHVIVVQREPSIWIDTMLASLHAQRLRPWRITVVDSGFADDLPSHFDALDDVRRLRLATDPGFAGACNQASFSLRDAGCLVLMTPGIIPAQHFLQRMAEAFRSNPNLGIIGCKVLNRDVDTIDQVGGRLSPNALPLADGRGQPDRGQFRGLRDVPAVLEPPVAIRAEVWCELKGFDPDFRPYGYELLDFCCRARAAHWRVGVDCDVTASRLDGPAELDPAHLRILFRNRSRFLRKYYSRGQWWGGFLPAEIRWLFSRASRGRRRAALASLLPGRGEGKTPPPRTGR